MTPKEPTAVAWVSLGCPKNLVDTETMLADLAHAGCELPVAMDQADVIAINTCGFLASAREEALDVLAEAIEHRRTGRARRIVVAGCMPSYLQASNTTSALLDEADVVLGVNDRRSIVQAVLADAPASCVTAEPIALDADGEARLRMTPPHTAYLRLAEGCSRACTFCAIPAIRGPLRSRSARAILDEAAALAEDSAVELNLIAQETTAWGEDLGPGHRLADLLEQLDQIESVEWIRLLYTYPRRFDDRLIDTLADGSRLVPYLDMPLQHIADDVLARMGRGVTRSAIATLLDKLRSRIPGLALRTSFIVGFPGESQADFDELLAFVEDSAFDAVGVFEYSPEPGTPAAAMDGQIPAEVTTERAETLLAAQHELAEAANRSLIGQDIIVLVDGQDASGQTVGRYYGQAPDIDGLCILTEPRPAGEFVRGTITAASACDFTVQPD
jgi:ribosomal protein S12 methylthiotransferase